ncbi:hypothetical protein RB628_12125 [Streptomyces sp. ADMS]|uniref:hypothetical protein n=1 Tax=Streptomyces sp. ADMS TaxID=3071415 RepID=UPI00296EC1D7|nr:hypothetical protein [Streptomyces sp. ADMS]MDW4906063.1 hypothetical protein [Streptomyces sp. ADMS]
MKQRPLLANTERDPGHVQEAIALYERRAAVLPGPSGGRHGREQTTVTRVNEA